MSTTTPPDPCGPAQLLGLLEQLAAQLQQLEQAAAGLALGSAALQNHRRNGNYQQPRNWLR